MMGFEWLDEAPRVRLGHWPTPLEPLDRFTAWLDRPAGPRVWLKRDDCTGLATGGNKTRKLEYLLGAARASGHARVVTFGAVQSNHARQTAAACAKAGFECDLILVRQVEWPHPLYESSGNILLDRLLGARLHLVAPATVKEDTRRILASLDDPYLIPAGGSNAVGALGYVRCMAELEDDCRQVGIQPGCVMHASSSGGTQAGLVVGSACLAEPIPVLGVNTYQPVPGKVAETVDRLAAEVWAKMPVGELENIPPAQVLDNQFGTGYGLPTDAGKRAIETLAQTEGVLLDPVYSGKGMAGLIEQVRDGAFDGTDDVIFIHTGGAAALSVYDNAWASP